MDLAGRSVSGGARSRWIKQKEVFISSSNSTGGVLEGSQSSEYEENPKRAKIKPKRAKLMRNSRGLRSDFVTLEERG